MYLSNSILIGQREASKARHSGIRAEHYSGEPGRREQIGIAGPDMAGRGGGEDKKGYSAGVYEGGGESDG